MLKGHSRAPQSLVTPQNATILGLTVEQFGTEWCVYELWKQDQLLMLGVSRLNVAMNLTEAKSHAAFADHLTVHDPVGLVIKAVGKRDHCYNMRAAMLRSLPTQPPLNNFRTGVRQPMIVCNEDGRAFRTQVEVCQTYGLSPPALSNHLNGRVGYMSVKGLTFRREAASVVLAESDTAPDHKEHTA